MKRKKIVKNLLSGIIIAVLVLAMAFGIFFIFYKPTVIFDGENLTGNVMDGISSKGGSASYNVSAPESGIYKMTVLYANNHENGVHSYNI